MKLGDDDAPSSGRVLILVGVDPGDVTNAFFIA